jgi:hypothetical protein
MTFDVSIPNFRSLFTTSITEEVPVSTNPTESPPHHPTSQTLRNSSSGADHLLPDSPSYHHLVSLVAREEHLLLGLHGLLLASEVLVVELPCVYMSTPAEVAIT